MCYSPMNKHLTQVLLCSLHDVNKLHIKINSAL